MRSSTLHVRRALHVLDSSSTHRDLMTSRIGEKGRGTTDFVGLDPGVVHSSTNIAASASFVLDGCASRGDNEPRPRGSAMLAARMRLRMAVGMLFAGAVACSQSPSAPSPPRSAAIVTAYHGCQTVLDSFGLLMPESPWYVGFGTPEPEGSNTYPFGDVPSGQWSMTVCATGETRGSIESITRTLRDASTGAMLGTLTDSGGPLFVLRGIDIFLTSGYQEFHFVFAGGPQGLGFRGQPAILQVVVRVRDTNGSPWTLSGELAILPFPTPTLRSPIGVAVRQNDPRTGCGFDPGAGYGFVVDVSWDELPQEWGVNDYVVALLDGTGQSLDQFYSHTGSSASSLRIVRCASYVPVGKEHGATVGVTAVSSRYRTMSPWATARFDFQSCREAGTPACN